MPTENDPSPVGDAAPVASSSEGRVKWFDANKGYGFIQLDGATSDVFLHVKELRKCGILALNDGAPVSFTAVKGTKGFYATDIKVLPK